uniref:Secreted protein n=1 Tax=Caenorhabditis tropicalis TaxID=1561998 RepID=A0A1I7UUC7_9PELO
MTSKIILSVVLFAFVTVASAQLWCMYEFIKRIITTKTIKRTVTDVELDNAQEVDVLKTAMDMELVVVEETTVTLDSITRKRPFHR